MSTLFFEGFERGYNDLRLDENYWRQEFSEQEGGVASPQYAFEGYTHQSGSLNQKQYSLIFEYEPKQLQYSPTTYTTSDFSMELPSGQFNTFDYIDNSMYPCVGNAPGYLTLLNVNARNQFNLAPIDYLSLSGFDYVSENATSAYVACRFLGLETKHIDFLDNPDRFGDKHPLMAFVSGNQTGMLLSLVMVSGNWFRNKKIDGDRSPITMGLQVEQNGQISGIFDMNVAPEAQQFHIRSVADATGPHRMEINTGRILTIQGDLGNPNLIANYNSTMSRWAYLNVEIQYEPVPLVSLRVEDIDCAAIPLDDPSVDMADRTNPNLNFEIELEAVHFNEVQFFNRSYDSHIKELEPWPKPANDPLLLRWEEWRYLHNYYMAGRHMVLDDIHINDNVLPEPTGRLGSEARVVRLYPGFPSTMDNDLGPPTGMANDAYFLDGLSDWSGVDEISKYIADDVLEPDDSSREYYLNLIAKRACVRDKDCNREGIPWVEGTCGGGAKYISSYNSGEIQTFPFFPNVDYQGFQNQALFNPDVFYSGCQWRNYTDEFGLLFFADEESGWRHLLSSGIGGVKVYNEYKNNFLNASFENVFFSPDSQNWPPVDLNKTDAHLIYDSSSLFALGSTYIFNTGIATTGTETFFSDDRMCLITGTNMMLPADPEKWPVGRGINFNGGHVLPYMTNLGRYMYQMQRFGVCENCPVTNGIDRWSGSGVNSGEAWTISAWVYFENEDDIVHLYSRFFDDDVNISGGIDYVRGMDRNQYLFILGDDPPGDPIFPDAYFLSCENPPDPNSVSPDPSWWDCNDYYTVTGGIPPLNRANNYGEWQFALYATRTGIKLSTIGAATNLYYYRFQQDPATFDPQSPNAPAGFHNPDSVPYTQQFEGSMDNPIGYREWFFSGEIPVKQWCQIEINKSSDRTVRVFASGYPASGHQVVAGSNSFNWYRGLMQDICGETLTGPTPDLYRFNASGFNFNYLDETVPSVEVFPWVDVGPIFNSIYPIEGNAAMIGYPNPMIEVPARVGGGYSQIADYVYVTGEATHLSQYQVPTINVPVPDDFYMSCESILTGKNRQCTYDKYYLFQDPISNNNWSSGLFVSNSGFRFGVKKL